MLFEFRIRDFGFLRRARASAFLLLALGPGCLARGPAFATFQIRVLPAAGVGLRMERVHAEALEMFHTTRFRDRVVSELAQSNIRLPRQWTKKVFIGIKEGQLELLVRVRADSEDEARAICNVISRMLVLELTKEKKYRARVIWRE